MQELRLKIAKMTCTNCALGIEKICKKIKGVEDASVSYVNSAGVFLLEDASLKDKLIKQIENLGYEVLKEGQSLDKAAQQELLSLRKNLILSIIISLVLMSLAMLVPMVWPAFSSDARLSLISNYAQLILAFVGIFYCGRDFFAHCFKGLWARNLDMNTLVALGSFVAFLYSVLVFMGVFKDMHFYFEGASMIISFVLLGRYLEARAKFKASVFAQKLASLDTQKALIYQSDGSLKEISSTFVKAGDKLCVRKGESVCADGVLLSAEAEFDLSFLTGEFMPVLRKKGDMIESGAVALSDNTLIEASKKAMDSTLEQLKDLAFKANSAKMPIARLVNVISAYFVGFILLLALGVFIFYALNLGLNEAFLRASATLLISCPCALGLATPISLVSALSNASRHFIFVKNPAALQILGKINTAFFDKTGTLTKDELSVVASDLSKSDFSKLASIESLSSHPIAKAIVAHSSSTFETPKGEYISFLGRGASFKEGADEYLLGNLSLMQERGLAPSKATSDFVASNELRAPLLVYFAKNGQILGVVCLKNEPRASAKPLIAYFKSQKIASVILSGDNEKSVQECAKALDIDEFKAALAPEQKLECIKEYEKRGLCLFVGDGINDSAALSLANVSIAMNGGSALAKSAGDFILMNDDLSAVSYAHKLSRKTMRIIKENLFWAFLYNILCIPIAAGFVPFISLSPHLAALAMSFSSMSVVLNSLRLRKNL